MSKLPTKSPIKPIVLLSKPSLSQNIGACARAMKNFGLSEMRLIDPQADWLDKNARALSADADDILENAKSFKTTHDAFADLQHIYATTARPRDMIKDVVTPKELAPEVHIQTHQGKKIGILMGSEKAGLDNEDIALCDKIVTIPLNPNFSSINLAQATILVCYELYQYGLDNNGKANLDKAWEKEDVPAPRQELFGLFEHLETELERRNYYRCADKRTIMDRNLRNMLSRADFTSQEVRTLRGVISSLCAHQTKDGV